MLHGLLDRAALSRAQEVWRAAEAEPRRQWEERQRQQPQAAFEAYSIKDLLAVDDVFLELVDHPELVGVLGHVAGGGGLEEDSLMAEGSRYFGTMRLGGACNGGANMQGYIVPPNPDGYTMCVSHRTFRLAA